MRSDSKIVGGIEPGRIELDHSLSRRNFLRNFLLTHLRSSSDAVAVSESPIGRIAVRRLSLENDGE